MVAARNNEFCSEHSGHCAQLDAGSHRFDRLDRAIAEVRAQLNKILWTLLCGLAAVVFATVWGTVLSTRDRTERFKAARDVAARVDARAETLRAETLRAETP